MRRRILQTQVALLTTAIIKKTESTIGDDDDRFVAGILFLYFQTTLRSYFREALRRRPLLR
jgi:hypothetical protein